MVVVVAVLLEVEVAALLVGVGVVALLVVVVGVVEEEVQRHDQYQL